MAVLFQQELRTVVIFACLAVLPLIRLGAGDLHNDEVIYASRAADCAATGTLLPDVDLLQMYGRQPPLCVWMMAASMNVFGQSAFSARLFAALCMSVLLIAVYSMARRMMAQRTALGVTALLASSSLLFKFSQMGQLDVPWLAVVAVAIAMFMSAYESRSRRMLIASAVVFGLSFETKLFISCVPLLVLLVWTGLQWKLNRESRRTIVRTMGLFVAMVIAVATPWHVWMFVHYGKSFYDVAIAGDIIARSVSGLDTSPHDSGRFFYPNQILIGFPLLGFVVLFACYRLRNARATHHDRRSPWEMFAWCWAVIPMVVLMAMKGQSQSYAIQLLPPLALLCGLAIDEFDAARVSRWWSAAGLIALACATAWSSSIYVRDGFREVIAPGSARAAVTATPFLIALAVAAGLVIIIVVVAARSSGLIRKWVWMIPTYGAALFLIVREVDSATDQSASRFSGARAVAEMLPRNAPVVLLTDPHLFVRDEVMQFHFYDASKNLFQRLIVRDRYGVADSLRINDSIHWAVVVRTDPYLNKDTSVARCERAIESQRFVVQSRLALYDVYAR